MDEQQFYLLNYTHQKLKELLNKLDMNMMLTQEQYDKLINKIGLDNISTFTGNYYDLDNTPLIPTKTSQLMNNSGLLDLHHLETINEQIQTLVNRVGELEPRVEELESIPDILLEINGIEERVANIQEDILYLQEFCADYKIDFENLYDITMDIKEVNDTLEDRLLYTNEKINLCIDLVDLNTSDITVIIDSIKEIDSQLESLKLAQKDLSDRADRVEEAIDLLNVPELKQQVDDLQQQFENVCLDKYATEETVVAFLERSNNIYQEYASLTRDLSQIENRVTMLSQAAVEAKNNLNKIVNSVDQNAAEINSMKGSIDVLRKTIDSLSDIDESLLAELNAKAESLNESFEVIQSQINKIEFLDFVTDDELETFKGNINNEVLLINRAIHSMNLDLTRLNAIDHSLYVTKEIVNDINNRLELHNSKANAQIDEINSKLLRFGNLNIDTIATIAYVDSRATEFSNALNETNKRIDATNFKVDLITNASEELETRYTQALTVITALQKTVAELTVRVTALENKNN